MLRNTTVCRCPSAASASPICSVTRSRKAVDRLPFGADGVPTQTRDDLGRADGGRDVVGGPQRALRDDLAG